MTMQMYQSIVRIKSQADLVFGAGFLVKGGQIVSCSHVVADSLNIKREANRNEIPNDEVYLDFPLLQPNVQQRAKIIYWNVESDIVLLKLVSTAPKGISPVELTVLEDYNDCRFTACGFPEDVDGRIDYSHGKMYGRAEDGKIMIESDVSQMGGKNQGVRGGYSGGPVWHNGVDKLAGMIVERLSVGTKSYIIPGSEILKALSVSEETFNKVDVMDPKSKYLTWMLGNSKLILPTIEQDDLNEVQERVSLISVYTALSTYGVNYGQNLSWSDLQDNEARFSAVECLNENDKLVLLGDAGSGKTAFVNFAVSCLAGEALGRKISNLDTLTDSNPSGWNHGALLPVRIVLRDFIAFRLPVDGQNISDEHIWQYIEENLISADLDNGFLQSLKRTLRLKGGLVFFDGLDEVPEEYRQWVCEAIEKFIENHPKCKCLVTSRPYAYQNEMWRLKTFKVALLAPFGKLEVRLFIDRWYKCVANRKNWNDIDSRVKRFRDHIIGHDRLMDLAGNPLLLTLMVSLHTWKEEKIPHKREELYAKSLDYLLTGWEEQREVSGDNNLVLPNQPCVEEWRKIKDHAGLDKLLNRLAFEVHRKQSYSIKTQADLYDHHSKEHADILESVLIQGLINISQNPDVKPLRLVEYLRDRAQLIVKNGDKTYAFIHRTFQEYLAARFLARHDDYPEIIVRLVKENPVHWREVASLAGVRASQDNKILLWELIEALTEEKTEMSHEDYWCIHIASRIIADVDNDMNDTIKNKAGRLYKRLVNLRGKLLEIIYGQHTSPSLNIPSERSEAGINLSVIGDPRFHDDFWCLPEWKTDENLGFKLVPAGKFIMGWGDKGEYAQHELDLPDFWMAKYPVTVQQFRMFYDVPTYRSNNITTCPVVGVEWFDAWQYTVLLQEQLYAYAKKQIQTNNKDPLWAGLANGYLHVTLPSEAEWEKAARGWDGHIYPWEGEFDINKANINQTGIGKPSVVGCFPEGVSAQYGVHDMIGNVWEWTRSIQETDPDNKEGKIIFKYPYQANDGREIVFTNNERLRNRRTRVLRGGAFDFLGIPSCYVRQHSLPKNTNAHIGFRICISSFKPQMEE